MLGLLCLGSDGITQQGAWLSLSPPPDGTKLGFSVASKVSQLWEFLGLAPWPGYAMIPCSTVRGIGGSGARAAVEGRSPSLACETLHTPQSPSVSG